LVRHHKCTGMVHQICCSIRYRSVIFSRTRQMHAGEFSLCKVSAIITAMSKTYNTLVVCTAGQHRSPTTKRLLEENYDVNARSAGIHEQAQTKVTQEMIDWADFIIAMDERTDGHKTYLEENFSIGDTPVYIFDIPDQFEKEDPELISLLKDKLNVFVDRINNAEEA